MVPRRIKLSGFLSYKHEQEISFDDASLWMLCGPNGSGKSSVFDAITYALFGYHRGGGQDVSELINKQSDTLAVDFEFSIADQRYRIRRTARRQNNGSMQSTVQAYRLDGGKWVQVENTDRANGLKEWVRDRIGLDYETFTSSVLLMQGRAEQLLNSKPSDRAAMLAKIVDLERYQKLHKKADDRRRELAARLDGITAQLAGLREVSDEEYTAAAARIQQAEAERAAAQARIDERLSLERQARKWDAIQKRLADTKAKLAATENILRNAPVIERDYNRFRELHSVQSAVSHILTERHRIVESERQTEELTRQQQVRTHDRRVTADRLNQARHERDALRQTLDEHEKAKAEVTRRLRGLTGLLEQVRQVEADAAELEQLNREWEALPSDAPSVVRRLESEHDQLARIEANLGSLTRLHEDRSELIRHTEELMRFRAEVERLKEQGSRHKTEREALEAETNQAEEALVQAQKDLAVAESRLQAAKGQAEELEQLSGEKTCRVCGQPLTESHLAAERIRRQHELRAAERRYQQLAAECDQARARADELQRRLAEARQQHEKLRDAYRDAYRSAQEVERALARLRESCRRSYLQLSDEFKVRVGIPEPGDWTAVTFPDRHDLSRLGAEAARISTVQRELRKAREQAEKVQSLQTRLAVIRERLEGNRRRLPTTDLARIHEDYATLQGRESSLDASIQATKKAIQRAERDLEAAQRDLTRIDQELTELTGKLANEEQSRQRSQELIERAKQSLPEAWRARVETAGLSEHLAWKEEYDRLQQEDVEKRYTDLQAARERQSQLRAEIAQLENDAAVFPPECRRNPDELQAEVEEARRRLDACYQQMQDAHLALDELDRLRRQRDELDSQYKQLDVEHNRYKVLAGLLSRDRLQRFLVRKAESQIVDYANAVLDRLSGGQLFLKLVRSDDGTVDQVLDLECWNRTTGTAPISVAFLSGSQRFRVAVALALAIGQYASKQHRPIESVIIDEGFGCLDRAGRQVMIQELQNLRGQMRCILLVSHQEEFADAFPDGYRFELQEGTTQVSRIAR